MCCLLRQSCIVENQLRSSGYEGWTALRANGFKTIDATQLAGGEIHEAVKCTESAVKYTDASN